MARASRKMPTADEPLDVLLMLDEFANFGRMDYLFSAMAALAGYRIRVFVIVQSGHQVEMTYSPAERKSLYDLCKFRAVYQPNASRVRLKRFPSCSGPRPSSCATAAIRAVRRTSLWSSNNHGR